MKRYQIVAVRAAGPRSVHGPYQNVYVADGAAKMLLDLDPDVERVSFQCLEDQGQAPPDKRQPVAREGRR